MVDQEMVDRFAEVTLDRQFIHVDPARARLTPFGGTIAHGYLTLSLLPHLMMSADLPTSRHAKMAVNYGLDRLRFLTPVRTGSRIRATITMVSSELRSSGTLQQALDVVVEIEGHDRPALVATLLSQIAV